MYKKIIAGALIAFAAIFFSVTGVNVRHQYKQVNPQPAAHAAHHNLSLQARSEHMLTFVDEDGEDTSLCTGTAIAKHAILTAEHCNARAEVTTIELDYSTRRYHIFATSYDGHDHVIYLLDGPALTSIAPYKVRAPKIGENVVVEGFGEGIYPAVEKAGKVIDYYDPSDVDQAQQMVYFSNPVIHGDSGSAIFALDGSIVGLVTYKTKDGGSGFQLAFPPRVIKFAQAFQGETK